MINETNVYPKTGDNPTISNSDSSKANLALCFSGGGSRALTCAWGQMLGLKTLNLIDQARYISSVSGGTWASSIYTYLPTHISDDDLLGTYYPPQNLSLTDAAGQLNVNNLTPYSLGQAPASLGVTELAESGLQFLIENIFHQSNYKWLWAFLVAQFILEHYGLRKKGEHEWSSSKYFSLSEKYAATHFPAGGPSIEDFLFVRSGRPFLIMNDNLMQKEGVNIVQLPNQVTPVSGGAQGQTPNTTIIGGGSVESYGYASTLEQDSAATSPVEITISQPYSLIDIVSTSSAFFAESLASWIQEEFKDIEKRKALISAIQAKLKPEHQESLIAKAKEDGLYALELSEMIEKSLEEVVLKDSSFLEKVIPTYNYWPIGEVSQNREMQFTDGGTLDNTGVVGLLAQTDTGQHNQAPIRLVVFDNTSTPLTKINGHIIAASQAAPLFGIDFDTDTGIYQPFTDAQKDPENEAFDPMSLITVFNNPGEESTTPFDLLVQGLYDSNCGAASGTNDATQNNDPAFYQLELTTVDNSLANVTAGRTVHMMYIQNVKMMHWQNEIGDETLKNEIADGQNSSSLPFETFKNFPYYDTFIKIGLKPKESNALSQMWAWAITDDSSPLKEALQEFIENVA
jgi:hypothetical protein